MIQIGKAQLDFTYKKSFIPIISAAQIFSSKMKGLALRPLEILKFPENANAYLLVSPLGSQDAPTSMGSCY